MNQQAHDPLLSFVKIALLIAFAYLFFAYTVTGELIYDSVIRAPEVRKQVVSSPEIVVGDQMWLQQAVVVENKGHSDSKNLRIITALPNGSILRYQVISNEIYTVDPASDAQKLVVTMPRLAPGMDVAVTILVEQPAELDDVDPQVTAMYDGGVAAPMDELTSAEEMQAWQGAVGAGLFQFQQRLSQYGIDQFIAQVDGALAEMPTLAANLGIFGVATIGPRTSEPATAPALLVMLLILVAALFFFGWDGLHLTGAVLVGLFLWLFTDFYVSALWFAPAILLALLIGYRSGAVWIITTLIVLLLASSVSVSELTCSLQGRSQRMYNIFTCIPVLAPGGLLIAYIWLTMFFSTKRSARLETQPDSLRNE